MAGKKTEKAEIAVVTLDQVEAKDLFDSRRESDAGQRFGWTLRYNDVSAE